MRLKRNILLIKSLSLCFQFYQSGVVFMYWLECMSVADFFVKVILLSVCVYRCVQQKLWIVIAKGLRYV